jgi:hypothetical protein
MYTTLETTVGREGWDQLKDQFEQLSFLKARARGGVSNMLY